MLEKIRETKYWVLDIHLQFFSEVEMLPEDVVSLLRIRFYKPPLSSRVLVGHLDVDSNSEHSDDKPSFVCPMNEILEEVRWVTSDDRTWQAADQQIDAYLSAVPKLEEWFCFARVAIEFDLEYEWDWDDESGDPSFTDGILMPLYRALEVDMLGPKAAKLTITPVEML